MSNPNPQVTKMAYSFKEALALFNDCTEYVQEAQNATFVSIDGDIRTEFVGGSRWEIFVNGEWFAYIEL